MKKEIIEYEEALALKVLGYSEFKTGINSFGFYCEGVFYPLYRNHQDYQPEHIYREVDAPLYQQAFRWFREKYKLFGEVNLTTKQEDVESFEFFVLNVNEPLFESDDYTVYEEAELACLRKLIEIVNQNNEDPGLHEIKTLDFKI